MHDQRVTNHIPGEDYYKCTIHGVKFTNISGAHFIDCTFHECYFTRTERVLFKGCTFHRCTFLEWHDRCKIAGNSWGNCRFNCKFTGSTLDFDFPGTDVSHEGNTILMKQKTPAAARQHKCRINKKIKAGTPVTLPNGKRVVLDSTLTYEGVTYDYPQIR